MRGASVWKARDWAIAAARERFLAGDEIRDAAVRPEILRSWQRCRDEYKIDPGQVRAPPAEDYCDHSLTSARVVAELGSVGRSLLKDVDGVGGIVVITDGSCRILATIGDRGARRHGEQSNLAPWSAWSERADGTNGMGTALADPGGILVRRSEHWCEGLRDWSCAGTTIREPATGFPLAVLDVSAWRQPLPDATLPWLRRAVRGIERELREQARRDAASLEAALESMDCRVSRPLLALDPGGGVVAANDKAASLTGISRLGRAIDVPALRDLVYCGVAQARADRSWVGFAEPFIPAAGDIVPLTMRPVVQDNRVIGILGTLGESEGEELTLAAASARPSPPEPRQVVGLQANRLIFLHPEQIIFAEAEGNTVWLTTDHGRIRARERGLAKLVADLGDEGFIRVHHHFAVNSRRVREIRRGFRGQLSLVMDPGCRKAVPVSRRREPAVRRALVL